jgi:hypothetical protein
MGQEAVVQRNEARERERCRRDERRTPMELFLGSRRVS